MSGLNSRGAGPRAEPQGLGICEHADDYPSQLTAVYKLHTVRRGLPN